MLLLSAWTVKADQKLNLTKAEAENIKSYLLKSQQ